ncbi:phasin family protein [Shewanella corallii]|uniref:Phasin family protein n=2 Tax=Shewanella TaxID=22 RepID=A0ABT0NAF6_9GAMM|nr:MULTISPECIES: phasin family protein [Shewanella]MCL1039158.1 phasin family protein [Shewanella submarina]MCL2914851.1 phasin family protein [Shewanella corallii]
MYTDMFKMFSEQAEKSLAPYQKFNALMAKHVEQITELQVNAMKAYSELGLAQFKAASEVKDVTSLAAFNGQQMATLTKLSQQLMDDSNKIQNIAKTFKDDVDQLTTENIKAATPA